MKSVSTLLLGTLATSVAAVPFRPWGGFGGKPGGQAPSGTAPVSSSTESVAVVAATSVAVAASSVVAVSSVTPVASVVASSSDVAVASSVVGNAAVATSASAASAASPTVWLAGDSTMALGGGGTGTQGWGVYLPYSLSIPVVNDAVAGRSARSYTDENRFYTLSQQVNSGDIVIIEFGHNDGGSLTPTDNGRSDCVGSGNETCTTDAGLIVYTYPEYLTNATELMTAKGATVILASPTPDDPCETDSTCPYTAPRFTGYCEDVVGNFTGTASFVDHGLYVATEFAAIGATTVNTYYPIDHTHTAPIAADIVAGQFIKGVLCADDNPLAQYVLNTTDSVTGSCL